MTSPAPRSAIAAALALALVLFASCAGTDVVAAKAPAAFKALEAAPGIKVSWSAEDGAWVLAAPDGESVAFSADFSRNGGGSAMADMDKPDVEFSFDAAPFLAAGLDPAKLPAVDGITYELEEGRFMYHFELGAEVFPREAASSLDATLAALVKLERSRLGYHDKLDHYGLKLGDGNMLEWARDLAANDKDLVFVLNPGPLAAAGVDLAKVKGWTLARVETKDDSGKTVFVDKLLKPYTLR